MLGSVNWNQAIALIVILLISIDFHEFAHATVAYALGDDTPARNGQLSLNPFVHMDQVGILLLFITSIFGYPFTYGRTFIQPSKLKFGPQRGGAIVAIAGPLTNLLLAIIVAVILRLNQNGGCGLPSQYTYYLALGLYVNLALFIFNLIPIPPLDGFNIISAFLTTRQLYSLSPFIQYAPILILVIVIFPGLLNQIFVADYDIGIKLYPNILFWLSNGPNVTGRFC